MAAAAGKEKNWVTALSSHAVFQALSAVSGVLALFDALLMVGVLAMSSALGYSTMSSMATNSTATATA